MGLFEKKESAEKNINVMSKSERESAVLALESEREEVTEDIEALMREIAKEMRQGRLKKRYKR